MTVNNSVILLRREARLVLAAINASSLGAKSVYPCCASRTCATDTLTPEGNVDPLGKKYGIMVALIKEEKVETLR